MQKLGTPVLLLVAILLVVGFLYSPQGCQGGGSGSMSAAAEVELKQPVQKVGQTSIFAAEAAKVVANMRDASMQQALQGGGVPELSPYQYLSIYMQAASSLARQAAVVELGRAQAIDIDEEKMEAVVRQMNEDTLTQNKQQFDMMQAIQIGPMESRIAQLKKDKAKPEEIAKAEKALADVRAMTFDKAFEQQSGAPPQAWVEAQTKQIVQTAANDPVVARGIVASAIQDELTTRFSKAVDVSDGALKASYDKVVYKQIMLTGENAESKANEVLKKIKGGLDFDQAAKQFSMLKKPDGSVQLENTIDARLDMLGDEMKQPILKLDPGSVSEVEEYAASFYIYKLVAIRPEVPKEFEAQKKQRAEMLRQRQVAAKLNDAIVGLIGESGEKVQWVDEGFKLLSDYMNTAKATDEAAALDKIVQATDELNTTFTEVGPLVRYAAITQLQVLTKDPAKKKALDAQMLDAFERVTEIAPSVEIRFQYINALLTAGNGDKALDLLLDNAIAASPVSDTTKPIIEKVEALLPKAANRATKGNKVVDEVQEEIKRWRADLEQRKKEEEEEKKRNATEEAELKKKEGSQKAQAPNSPAAPGTTIPEPTPVEPEPIEPKKPGSGG